MAMKDALVPEFEHEMALTRKLLERVPDERFDWQPHVKSMSLGRLAGHLAELPGWAGVTLQQDAFDVQPEGAAPYTPPPTTTRADVLAQFDANLEKARAAIGATSDAEFSKPWSFQKGGAVLWTMPKAVVLRNFVLNHNVHHRAQLGVYLRMVDVLLPSTYGPSADDAGM